MHLSKTHTTVLSHACIYVHKHRQASSTLHGRARGKIMRYEVGGAAVVSKQVGVLMDRHCNHPCNPAANDPLLPKKQGDPSTLHAAAPAAESCTRQTGVVEGVTEASPTQGVGSNTWGPVNVGQTLQVMRPKACYSLPKGGRREAGCGPQAGVWFAWASMWACMWHPCGHPCGGLHGTRWFAAPACT